MSNTCIIKQWPIYVYMKYNEKSACLGLQEIQLGTWWIQTDGIVYSRNSIYMS